MINWTWYITQKKIWNPLISINCKLQINCKYSMQTQAKWITELKKTLLNHWKAMKTVQLTSISVRTKVENQAGTIQLSKYIVYTRCAQNLHNCIQMLSWWRPNAKNIKFDKDRKWLRLTFLLSKISSNKIWFRQSIYTILTIEICCNRKIHRK